MYLCKNEGISMNREEVVEQRAKQLAIEDPDNYYYKDRGDSWAFYRFNDVIGDWTGGVHMREKE